MEEWPGDAEAVVLCVRWYLNFKLSYRDLASIMSERGIEMAHTTILRWVQHYTPEFEKRWQRYARPVGGQDGGFLSEPAPGWERVAELKDSQEAETGSSA